MTEPTFKEAFRNEFHKLREAGRENFDRVFMFAVDYDRHGLARLMMAMDINKSLDLETYLKRCMTAKDPKMFDTLWRHYEPDHEACIRLLAWSAMHSFEHGARLVLAKTDNLNDVIQSSWFDGVGRRPFIERIKEQFDIERAQQERTNIAQRLEANHTASAPKRRM